MQKNQIKFDLEKVAAGIKKAASAIRSTMGAKGRTILIRNEHGQVIATKDGANTAKTINLKDPEEDIGAKLVIDAAVKTANEAGDGTTSTTVILDNLIEHGSHEKDRVKLVSALREAANQIPELIKKMAKPVEGDDLYNVALISSNGDKEVADIVHEAISEVGPDGIVSVVDSPNMETYMDVVDGIRVASGMFTPHFINNPRRRTCEFTDPIFCVSNESLTRIDQVQNVMEMAYRANRPLVLMCSNLEGEAFSFIVRNVVGGKIKACVSKTPGYKDSQEDYMEDMQSVIGGEFISTLRGQNIKESFKYIEHFGEARKVVISEEQMIITGDPGVSNVEDRIDLIKGQIEDQINPSTIEYMKGRVSALSGGIGAIFVGHRSDSGQKEKRDRVEDAVSAVKSAVEEGTMPGAGAAYHSLAKYFEKDIPVLAYSLEGPMWQIGENAGILLGIMTDACKDKKVINVVTGAAVDPYKAGIIDPAKVVRSAIQNAINTACVVLSSSAIIFDDESK